MPVLHPRPCGCVRASQNGFVFVPEGLLTPNPSPARGEGSNCWPAAMVNRHCGCRGAGVGADDRTGWVGRGGDESACRLRDRPQRPQRRRDRRGPASGVGSGHGGQGIAVAPAEVTGATLPIRGEAKCPAGVPAIFVGATARARQLLPRLDVESLRLRRHRDPDRGRPVAADGPPAARRAVCRLHVPGRHGGLPLVDRRGELHAAAADAGGRAAGRVLCLAAAISRGLSTATAFDGAFAARLRLDGHHHRIRAGVGRVAAVRRLRPHVLSAAAAGKVLRTSIPSGMPRSRASGRPTGPSCA